VQIQANFEHCEGSAKLAVFAIALFSLGVWHLVTGLMSGTGEFPAAL
jgi:hypothetical protein